jgi:hypothetical protein
LVIYRTKKIGRNIYRTKEANRIIQDQNLSIPKGIFIVEARLFTASYITRDTSRAYLEVRGVLVRFLLETL